MVGIDDQATLRAIEVVARIDQTVIAVGHCGKPQRPGTAATRARRAGRGQTALAVSDPTQGTGFFAQLRFTLTSKLGLRNRLLAFALVCLALAVVGWVGLVLHARTNHHALDAHVAAGGPAWAFHPPPAARWLEISAIGGAAGAVLGLVFGLVRQSRHRLRSSYQIGTASDVDLAIVGTPTSSFPLVALAGDVFLFHAWPGLDGEVVRDGVTTSFAELHRAPALDRVIAIPIPAHSVIHARRGNISFTIKPVAAPKTLDLRSRRFHPAMVLATTGSLILHLALLACLRLDDPVAGDVGVELTYAGHREVSLDPVTSEAAVTRDSATVRGDAASPLDPGSMQLRDPSSRRSPSAGASRAAMDPRTARERAIEDARRSGLLVALEGATIANVIGSADLGSGFNPDGGVVGGNALGDDLGSSAFGNSYGGTCMGCSGTIAGKRVVIASPFGGELRCRGPLCGSRNVIIEPKAPRSSSRTELAIIRRYIRRFHSHFQYCYERELLARPNLAGDVTATFLIHLDGAVASAHATGFDAAVATCVASVIRNIRFPRGTVEEPAQVNYPFSFRRSG